MHSCHSDSDDDKPIINVAHARRRAQKEMSMAKEERLILLRSNMRANKAVVKENLTQLRSKAEITFDRAPLQSGKDILDVAGTLCCEAKFLTEQMCKRFATFNAIVDCSQHMEQLLDKLDAHLEDAEECQETTEIEAAAKTGRDAIKFFADHFVKELDGESAQTQSMVVKVGSTVLGRFVKFLSAVKVSDAKKIRRKAKAEDKSRQESKKIIKKLRGDRE